MWPPARSRAAERINSSSNSADIAVPPAIGVTQRDVRVSRTGETHQPSWRQLRGLVVRSLPAQRDSGVRRSSRLDDDPGSGSSVQRIGLIVQCPLQLLPDDAGPLGPHSGDLAEFAGTGSNDAAQRPEVIDDCLGCPR